MTVNTSCAINKKRSCAVKCKRRRNEVSSAALPITLGRRTVITDQCLICIKQKQPKPQLYQQHVCAYLKSVETLGQSLLSEYVSVIIGFESNFVLLEPVETSTVTW